MHKEVIVEAPSRLHFGLFSIGDQVESRFGGIGLMISEPSVIVSATLGKPFDQSLTVDRERELAEQVLTHLFEAFRSEFSSLGFPSMQSIPVSLKLAQCPPRHAGYGTGTQLAFSMATSICELFELPRVSAVELAGILNRGKRSAIGSYGFFHGGLIVDRGKTQEQALSPLDFRTSFPDEWTIVTCCLKSQSGLFGSPEKAAFQSLSPTSEQERQCKIDIVRNMIIPGTMEQDYCKFADGLYEFGKQSGMMYSAIQGGPYNGPRVGRLVEEIRELKVPAVGQSSWGPVVFAITPSEDSAARLVSQLRERHGDQLSVSQTNANNTGASIRFND